jgi:hypothetical protein
MKTFRQLQVKLATLLDNAYTERRLTRREKNKLSHLIQQIAEDVLRSAPDDELKALHDKHAPTGYDEINAATAAFMKEILTDVYGLDVDDEVDISNPEQLSAHVARQLDAQLSEREHAAAQARANRKKTTKQIEKEQKLKAEAQNVHRSLQEVYRKLAAALHPDRERDDASRERKTALMQRVNVAYESKDLLQLLELQLEVEQVDKAHIRGLSDAKLLHYNKILREQCEELTQALQEAQAPFRHQFGLLAQRTLTISTVMMHMERDIRELRRAIAQLQGDLRNFLDTPYLKAWLRDYEILQQPGLEDVLALALEGDRDVQAAPKRRSRGSRRRS